MGAQREDGPAFPSPSVSQNQATGETVCHQSEAGMTLRDYFAARAMQGMLNGTCPDMNDRAEIAKRAYLMANVMLTARGA